MGTDTFSDVLLFTVEASVSETVLTGTPIPPSAGAGGMGVSTDGMVASIVPLPLCGSVDVKVIPGSPCGMVCGMDGVDGMETTSPPMLSGALGILSARPLIVSTEGDDLRSDPFHNAV